MRSKPLVGFLTVLVVLLVCVLPSLALFSKEPLFKNPKDDSLYVKVFTYLDAKGRIGISYGSAKRGNLSPKAQEYVLSQTYADSLESLKRGSSKPKVFIDLERDMKNAPIGNKVAATPKPTPNDLILISYYVYKDKKNHFFYSWEHAKRSFLSKEEQDYVLTQAYADSLSKCALFIPTIFDAPNISLVSLNIKRDMKLLPKVVTPTPTPTPTITPTPTPTPNPSDLITTKHFSYTNSKGTLSWSWVRVKRSTLSKEAQAYILTQAYRDSLKTLCHLTLYPKVYIDIERDMKLVPKVVTVQKK